MNLENEEERMRTLASRGEENEDGREERDSLAPPRT